MKKTSLDWVGHRFGSLTIVAFEGLRQYDRGRSAYFTFRCDCGTVFSGQKSNVLRRDPADCGCSAPLPDRTAPFGVSLNPVHKVWSHMIDRCQNPKNKSFKDYGGRGIAVCQRWKTGNGAVTGFECFLADMGPRPEGNFTIERVNNHGPYAPGNCMWLHKRDQGKNTRRVRLVRIGDKLQTIPDWCAETGVPYFTAIRRVSRGWPPDRAVTEPSRRAAV